MCLHEGTSVSIGSLQAFCPNKIDTETVMPWSSLAELFTQKEAGITPTAGEESVRYHYKDSKSKRVKTLNKLGIRVNIINLI